MLINWWIVTVLHELSRLISRYLTKKIDFPGKEKGREVCYFIRDSEFGKKVEGKVDERYTIDYPEAEQELFDKFFGSYCPAHKIYLQMLNKLKLVLKSGADITVRNKLGQTPIHLFAGEGGLRELKTIMEYGTSTSSSSSSNATKEERDREERTHQRRLLNATTSSGRTPLWFAACHDKGNDLSTKISHWLLSKGADPSMADENGLTPLHLAAFFGNLALVRLLVKYGANVNNVFTTKTCQLYYTDHKIHSGASPFSLAKKQGHYHILDFFHELMGT